MKRKLRQPVSGLTHLLAAVAATVALAWTLVVYVGSANAAPAGVASIAVFLGGMIALYLSSTLYHLLPLSSAGIARLRRLDHSMIYVFIAASYTPFCIMALRGAWGWSMLVTVWTLALLGVGTKLLWLESSRWIRIGLYLGMSWISVVILPKLWQVLPGASLIWLGVGGVIYTLGALVYAIRRPDPVPNVFGFHEIWHLFVVGGSFCHFWAVRQFLFY